MEPPIDSAPCDHYSTSADPALWWKAHFVEAAGQVVEFLGADGISIEGKRVADIGCGDGIIDLGVASLGKPAALVGFDIEETDAEELQRLAAENGVGVLPEGLTFQRSSAFEIPAPDDSFDLVFSWSAFEHISDPTAILREVRRVLTPTGVLFIQVWPFYDTAHGPHLQDWFPEGFAHHRYGSEELVRRVQESENQHMADEMLEVFRTLNGITADDLHASLRAAGFRIAKLELLTEVAHIPAEAANVPVSRIGLSGVKLLAVPAEVFDPAYEQCLADDHPILAAHVGDTSPAAALAAALMTRPDVAEAYGRPPTDNRAALLEWAATADARSDEEVSAQLLPHIAAYRQALTELDASRGR